MDKKTKKELEDKYRVVGIETPMRVKSDIKNRFNWKRVAQQLEATMNEMVNDGLQPSIVMDFSSHGLLVIGQRTPKQPPMLRTSFGDIPVPTPPSEEDVKKAVTAMKFQQLLAELDSLPAEPSDELLKKAVDSALQGADLSSVREISNLCNRVLEEHKNHTDCDVSSDLARVKKILDERMLFAEN